MRNCFKYLVLIFLISISLISRASDYLDSLRIKVLNMPEDTNKVLELKDLSYKYLKYDLDTATNLCSKSIKLAN